jgi:hypothetical protein
LEIRQLVEDRVFRWSGVQVFRESPLSLLNA